jgi:hypothetical protein
MDHGAESLSKCTNLFVAPFLNDIQTTGKKDYVTPVGDSTAKTRVFVFNPNPTALTLSWTTLFNGTQTKSVPANSATATTPIPTGSGARITTTQTAFAFTVTDSELNLFPSGSSQGAGMYLKHCVAAIWCIGWNRRSNKATHLVSLDR